jgi:hypothetical protein
MMAKSKVPSLTTRKFRFIVQVLIWTVAIVGLLVITDQAHPDHIEEQDRRQLKKKDLDDADSGYPFSDAFISYPYRHSKNKWAIVFHILGECIFLNLGFGAMQVMADVHMLTLSVSSIRSRIHDAGAEYCV